jgi:ABC-type glycerol-3-phosphate transport system substrate-binding protein
MRRKWIAALAALALFAALAGCGKSDDTSVQETEETPQATLEPVELPLDAADDTPDSLTDEEMEQVTAALTEAADTTTVVSSQADVTTVGDADMDVWVNQTQTVTEVEQSDDYADIEDMFEAIGPIELPMDYVD